MSLRFYKSNDLADTPLSPQEELVREEIREQIKHVHSTAKTAHVRIGRLRRDDLSASRATRYRAALVDRSEDGPLMPLGMIHEGGSRLHVLRSVLTELEERNLDILKELAVEGVPAGAVGAVVPAAEIQARSQEAVDENDARAKRCNERTIKKSKSQTRDVTRVDPSVKVAKTDQRTAQKKDHKLDVGEQAKIKQVGRIVVEAKDKVKQAVEPKKSAVRVSTQKHVSETESENEDNNEHGRDDDDSVCEDAESILSSACSNIELHTPPPTKSEANVKARTKIRRATSPVTTDSDDDLYSHESDSDISPEAEPLQPAPESTKTKKTVQFITVKGNEKRKASVSGGEDDEQIAKGKKQKAAPEPSGRKKPKTFHELKR